MDAFAERVRDGFTFGDFQYAIDDRSEDFLRKGVFSCYRPVPDDTPLSVARKEMSERDWVDMLYLAHTDKTGAFKRYASFYQTTNGQVYWSDEAQMSIYPENYHRELEKRYAATNRASEVITEIYCDPRRARAVHGRRARVREARPGRDHLRHHPPDRPGSRELPAVGEEALCLRDLQPCTSSTRRAVRSAPATPSAA
jgi:hypothetical protein